MSLLCSWFACVFFQLTTLPQVCEGLEFVVLEGQPEHIGAMVRTTSTKRYRVIHLIAWTGTAKQAGAGAGILKAEGFDLCGAAGDAGFNCLQAR